jgi:hypothetical protein
MTVTITPSNTDTAQTIISLQTITLGSIITGTLDLRGKYGAYIFCSVGRAGTTALTAGIAWKIRRLQNAGAQHQPHSATFVGDITVASAHPTCAASGNSAASANLVTVSTGFAVGDMVFVDDTGNVGLANSEWINVSKVTSTVTHQLDQSGGLQYAHNSTAAHAANHADIYGGVFVPGGCYVEVSADYGASTTGDTNFVRATYQTLDSQSAA